MRFERREMQKRAATRAITVPHPWTEEELVAIEEQILAEKTGDATPRYWEDVQVSDGIDTIIKGPLGLTDFIAFIAGGSAPIPRVAAHSVSHKRYHKHPKWAFGDPRTHALEPVSRCAPGAGSSLEKSRSANWASASNSEIAAPAPYFQNACETEVPGCAHSHDATVSPRAPNLRAQIIDLGRVAAIGAMSFSSISFLIS
jgi:hypothetical protein